MDIIYETGGDPGPKERYRVEVLTRNGNWREVYDVHSADVARAFADSAAREYSAPARVRDSQATDQPNRTQEKS